MEEMNATSEVITYGDHSLDAKPLGRYFKETDLLVTNYVKKFVLTIVECFERCLSTKLQSKGFRSNHKTRTAGICGRNTRGKQSSTK